MEVELTEKFLQACLLRCQRISYHCVITLVFSAFLHAFFFLVYCWVRRLYVGWMSPGPRSVVYEYRRISIVLYVWRLRPQNSASGTLLQRLYIYIPSPGESHPLILVKRSTCVQLSRALFRSASEKQMIYIFTYFVLATDENHCPTL